MSIYFAKNFKYKEMECPCCGKIHPIDPHLSFLLQSLREKINRPIYISRGGGIRCKKYNRKIGGYRYSPHLEGRAVDIHAKNMDIVSLAKQAKDIGFTRIGLYPSNNFIHVDVLQPRPSASWVRSKTGKYVYFKKLEEAIKFVKGENYEI